MYYYIQLKLSKGEGDFPMLHASETMDAVKAALRFDFQYDDELLPVLEQQLVSDGLAALSVENGELCGYPEPVVWLKLEMEVDPDDDEAQRACAG
jgi:hypothetical protein